MRVRSRSNTESRSVHLRGVWLWLAACALTACGPQPRPGAMEMQRALLEAGRIEIIVTDGDGSPLWGLGQRFAENIRAWGRRGSNGVRGSGQPSAAVNRAWRVDVSDGRAGSDEPSERAGMRFVIGLSSHGETARLARGIGAEILATGGFRIRGREHVGSGDALLARMQDPDRPGLPLVLLMGNRAADLARISTGLGAPWVPALRTWTNGGPGLCVERSELVWDRALERAAQADVARVSTVGPLRFHVSPAVDPGRSAAYFERCRAAVARVERWLDASLETRLDVYLYAHTEDFERALGPAQLACVDGPSLSTHALLVPGLPDDGGAAVARATALALRGVPEQDWLLEGIGTAAAGTWWGRPLDEWVGFLRVGGLLPARDQAPLVDAHQRWSEHALVPRRATLVLDCVADDSGKTLADLWSLRERLDLRAPDERVTSELRELLAPTFQEGEERRAGVLSDPERFFRGVSIVQTSSKAAVPGSSYAARELGSALEQARAAGAEACAFWVDAACDVPGRLLPERRSVVGNVSDATLAAACAEARGRGLVRMLALNPLEAVGGSWVDGGDSTEPEDIGDLFDRLGRITVHYGLLAELCRVELLSLGAGLRKASITKDAESDTDFMRRMKDIRRTRWREVIADVRSAFGGALTYAAYMREEVHRVTFWDDLDFIGLLGFGPLREEDLEFSTPDEGAPGAIVVMQSTDSMSIEEELWRQFQKARSLARDWKRPALFVQLGFPASDAAWRDWSWGRGSASDLEQDRYYTALAAVLQRRPSFKTRIAFFLWSWPLGSNQPHPAYSPLERPAGRHVQSILRRP